MNDITISAAFAWILAAVGVLLTLDKGADLISKYGKKAQAPEIKQNDEIADLRRRCNAIEDRLAKHDDLFDHDNARLKEIEKSSRMQLRAVRALLGAQLSGDNVDALQKCSTEIDDYLYDR